jgi:hypothetical protein
VPFYWFHFISFHFNSRKFHHPLNHLNIPVCTQTHTNPHMTPTHSTNQTKRESSNSPHIKISITIGWAWETEQLKIMRTGVLVYCRRSCEYKFNDCRCVCLWQVVGWNLNIVWDIMVGCVWHDTHTQCGVNEIERWLVVWLQFFFTSSLTQIELKNIKKISHESRKNFKAKQTETEKKFK